MNLVTKQIKGHEYYYLIERERHGKRVVTSRTVYIGNRQKLAELIQQSATAVLPDAFAVQSVGAALALGAAAEELEIEKLIDAVCPVRDGAAPVGRRLLLAAIHRVLSPRRENGICNLLPWYESSVMAELFPIPGPALDNRRMCEMLGRLTNKQVDEIEAAVVRQLVKMVPLRHRRDKTLRAHALVVVMGLVLAKVVQRRVKRAGAEAKSLGSVLRPLKDVQRARLQYGKDAPAALRALAADAWVPSTRTPRQTELLEALNLLTREELGITLQDRLTHKRRASRKGKAA